MIANSNLERKQINAQQNMDTVGRGWDLNAFYFTKSTP